jgi:hypothetical protein
MTAVINAFGDVFTAVAKRTYRGTAVVTGTFTGTPCGSISAQATLVVTIPSQIGGGRLGSFQSNELITASSLSDTSPCVDYLRQYPMNNGVADDFDCALSIGDHLRFTGYGGGNPPDPDGNANPQYCCTYDLIFDGSKFTGTATLTLKNVVGEFSCGCDSPTGLATCTDAGTVVVPIVVDLVIP